MRIEIPGGKLKKKKKGLSNEGPFKPIKGFLKINLKEHLMGSTFQFL